MDSEIAVTSPLAVEPTPSVYRTHSRTRPGKGRRAGMRHHHFFKRVTVTTMPLDDTGERVAVGLALSKGKNFSRKLGRHISAERCILAAESVTRVKQAKKWGVCTRAEAIELIRFLRETERVLFQELGGMSGAHVATGLPFAHAPVKAFPEGRQA